MQDADAVYIEKGRLDVRFYLWENVPARRVKKKPERKCSMAKTAKPGENVAYILLCRDSTLYCGWTNDLDKRVKAHNEGKGAKYTKGRRPVKLVYWEVFSSKQEAMRREAAIKRLSRMEKTLLIRQFSGGAEEGSLGIMQRSSTSSHSGRSFPP